MSNPSIIASVVNGSQLRPPAQTPLTALGASAGKDDEQDARELGGRGLLVQHEQPEEHPDGGFEGHEGPERGRCHVPQREQLEREGQDREQDRQPGRCGQDAEGEVAGGLRDADDRGRDGGDGDGE